MLPLLPLLPLPDVAVALFRQGTAATLETAGVAIHPPSHHSQPATASLHLTGQCADHCPSDTAFCPPSLLPARALGLKKVPRVWTVKVLGPNLKRSPWNTTATSPPMAAATQASRTSPQTSNMSSPKDRKASLPVVTKPEGVYTLHCHPLCCPRTHSSTSSPLILVAVRKHD